LANEIPDVESLRINHGEIEDADLDLLEQVVLGSQPSVSPPRGAAPLVHLERHAPKNPASKLID
jgi:hypothetical protein